MLNNIVTIKAGFLVLIALGGALVGGLATVTWISISIAPGCMATLSQEPRGPFGSMRMSDPDEFPLPSFSSENTPHSGGH